MLDNFEKTACAVMIRCFIEDYGAIRKIAILPCHLVYCRHIWRSRGGQLASPLPLLEP